MSERFVTVSTVTGFGICGCFTISRDMISVSQGGGNR